METFTADERAMLERMLDVQRDEVARLLSEVDDTAARARLVPSLTTPLGLVKHASVDSVREAFLAACEHSREVAAAHDLDEQFPWHQGPVSLRFIYGHMIAELARHAGHGDILVEQLKASAEQGATTR